MILFILYTIFILYWSLEGYSSALSICNIERYKKYKKISYVMRFLFSSLIFIFLYLKTNNFIDSIILILSFLLIVPIFYISSKYRIILSRSVLYFDVKNVNHEYNNFKNSTNRIIQLSISFIFVLYFITKNIYYNA